VNGGADSIVFRLDSTVLLYSLRGRSCFVHIRCCSLPHPHVTVGRKNRQHTRSTERWRGAF